MRKRSEEFTEEEKVILSFLAKGYTAGQISYNTKRTVSAVRDHIKRLKWRTEVANTCELVAKSIREGVI